MMKFRNLFDNQNLAVMLAENWEYDRERENPVEFCRSSANAIFVFFREGNPCFLRFAPLEEKQPEAIRAELHFSRYLRNNGYTAVETIPAKDGSEMVVRETPWGKHVAVTFKLVPGDDLEEIDYSDDMYYGFGEMLGRLHELSKNYKPEVRRTDWQSLLRWAAEVLEEYAAPEIALKEAAILEEFFTTLPMTTDNYGLIHYDFEMDNVFYDKETESYNIIDFDDSVYHWYAMDIVQSTNSIKSELPEKLHQQAEANFMDGYKSITAVDESMLAIMPTFKRYANLIGYARCLRSTHEQWLNEPEWMKELRVHLENSMSSSSINFGQTINYPE